MSARRVAVTGMGIVSSLGNDVATFWDNCCSGNTVVEEIPDKWKILNNYNSNYWSPIKQDPNYAEAGLTRFDTKRIGKFTQNALYASRKALDDSGLCFVTESKDMPYKIADYEPNRQGVFCGTGSGGSSAMVSDMRSHILRNHHVHSRSNKSDPNSCSDESAASKFLLNEDVGKFNPCSVVMTMPNSCSDAIAIRYGITGASNTYSYACASSTVSIGEAFKSIRSGEIDCALAGGSEHLEGDYGAFFRSFDVIQALTNAKTSKDECNRPFDENRSGFLFSQGASAILVLEEYDRAVERGAHIYCELAGYSRTFDSCDLMKIDPSGEKIISMLKTLLTSSDLQASDIDYINAHGTGTELNDQIECNVINKIFGGKVNVNSTKSLLGHSLGASGAVEALVTCLSLKTGQMHPSRNIISPIGDLNYVTEKRQETITNAISQSFAFGGHNAALLFKKAS